MEMMSFEVIGFLMFEGGTVWTLPQSDEMVIWNSHDELYHAQLWLIAG